MEELRASRLSRDRDGAVWFETPEARALDREGERGLGRHPLNGEPITSARTSRTHRLCLEERGFDLKINVWARTPLSPAADEDRLAGARDHEDRWSVVLYSTSASCHGRVFLTRMGRRTGSSCSDVLEAVGKDATRILLLSAARSQLDFDFELAGAAIERQPVYYVQLRARRGSRHLPHGADAASRSTAAELAALTNPASMRSSSSVCAPRGCFADIVGSPRRCTC